MTPHTTLAAGTVPMPVPAPRAPPVAAAAAPPKRTSTSRAHLPSTPPPPPASPPPAAARRTASPADTLSLHDILSATPISKAEVMGAVTLQPKSARAPQMPTYGNGAQGRLSVSGSVTLPNGGAAGPVTFTPGTRFDIGATVDNGLPTSLDVTRRSGSASAFGIASLEGAQLRDGQIQAGVRIFDLFKISKDITSDVIGTDRVPGTPNQLLAAVTRHKQDGMNGDFVADVRIAPTAPGQTVSFGSDAAFAFDPGTTATMTRRGSTTIYDIDANLRQASIGTDASGKFTSGAGHMRFQAVETRDRSGHSVWSVQIVNAGLMRNAHLTMPTNDGHMNRLDIGQLEVNGTPDRPVLTSQAGRITSVNMHAAVTGLNGVVNLGDTQNGGRNAELHLQSRNANGAPLAVDADIAMQLVPRTNARRGEDPYDHNFSFNANMSNVDARVVAPQSVGLINGGGLHADLGNGTAITGSGTIKVDRRNGSTSVVIEAPEGLTGSGVLKNIQVQRQLREYGIDLRIPEAKVTGALGTLDTDKGIFKGSATFGAFTELAGLTSPVQRAAVSNFMTQITLQGNGANKTQPLLEGTLSALMTGSSDTTRAPGAVLEPNPLTGPLPPTAYNDMLSRISGAIAVNNGGTVKLDAPFKFARDGGVAVTGARLAIRDATVHSAFASAAVLGGTAALPDAPPAININAPPTATPTATSVARADLLKADQTGPAELPPLTPLPALGAQPDPVTALDLPHTLDVPKALGTALREADVYGSYTTPDKATEIPLTVSMGLFNIHPTLTIAAGTRIDLGVQSAPQSDGTTQFTSQAPTWPNGEPNPNATQMSGIRFSKPLVIDGPGTHMEINGANFVPQVKDGHPTGEFDVQLDITDDKTSGFIGWTFRNTINSYARGAIQSILADKTGSAHNSLNVSQFAAAVTKAFDVHVDPSTNILDEIRAGMPAEARPLFDDILDKGRFSARGITQSDVTLNTAGQQVTVRTGAQVVVSNGPNGALHATATGDFGQTRLSAGGSTVSFSSAKATMAVDSGVDEKGHPIARYALTGLSADGLMLNGRSDAAEVKLDNAHVDDATITLQTAATDVSVTRASDCIAQPMINGALSVDARGVRAAAMSFKRRDGTTYTIANGAAATLNVDAAGALTGDNLQAPRGTVTASGLTGSFSADGQITPDGFATTNGQPIRYRVRSGTLTSGALSFDMSNGHIVAPQPLTLTDFDASMGNLPIRQGDPKSAPVMDLSHLDIRAREATVAFDKEGVEVRPVDSKATAWGAVNFTQQSPQMSVQAPQIVASGAVDSWRMSFDGKQFAAEMRNVYMMSKGKNLSATFEVPQAAPAPGAPQPPPAAPTIVNLTNTGGELFASTLGFKMTPEGQRAHIAATALVDVTAAIPPANAQTPTANTISGNGTGRARVSLVMSEDGNFKVKAKAHIVQADVTGSFSLDPDEAKKAAVRAARAVISRLPGSPLAPDAQVSPDVVREQIRRQTAPSSAVHQPPAPAPLPKPAPRRVAQPPHKPR